jgi:hypothetical protein
LVDRILVSWSWIRCVRLMLCSATAGDIISNFTHRRDDGGSTHLWNVGWQLFYTAVHPRRQIWTLMYILCALVLLLRNFSIILHYKLFHHSSDSKETVDVF